MQFAQRIRQQVLVYGSGDVGQHLPRPLKLTSTRTGLYTLQSFWEGPFREDAKHEIHLVPTRLTFLTLRHRRCVAPDFLVLG